MECYQWQNDVLPTAKELHVQVDKTSRWQNDAAPVLVNKVEGRKMQVTQKDTNKGGKMMR
jgi:hypothetical protein